MRSAGAATNEDDPMPAIRANSYPCDGVEVWVKGRPGHLGFKTEGEAQPKCSARVAMISGEPRKLSQSTPLGWQQIKASPAHHQSKLVPGKPLCDGVEEWGEGRPGVSTVG